MITILLSHYKWYIIHISVIGRCLQLCDRDVVAIASFASTSKAPRYISDDVIQNHTKSCHVGLTQWGALLRFTEILTKYVCEKFRDKRHCYIIVLCSFIWIECGCSYSLKRTSNKSIITTLSSFCINDNRSSPIIVFIPLSDYSLASSDEYYQKITHIARFTSS